MPGNCRWHLSTSPGGPSILSIERGMAELPSRPKLAAKPTCWPYFPRSSWHPCGLVAWGGTSMHWLAAAEFLRAAGAPGHATPWGDPGRAHKSNRIRVWHDLAHRTHWHQLMKGGNRECPLMSEWVAYFPLSRCQKCLPGTWLRGSEYRGGWKASPFRATLISLTPLCLHIYSSLLGMPSSIYLLSKTLLLADPSSPSSLWGVFLGSARQNYVLWCTHTHAHTHIPSTRYLILHLTYFISHALLIITHYNCCWHMAMPLGCPPAGFLPALLTDATKGVGLGEPVSTVWSYFQPQLKGQGQAISRWLVTCDVDQVRADSHCQGFGLGKTPATSSRKRSWKVMTHRQPDVVAAVMCFLDPIQDERLIPPVAESAASRQPSVVSNLWELSLWKSHPTPSPHKIMHPSWESPYSMAGWHRSRVNFLGKFWSAILASECPL